MFMQSDKTTALDAAVVVVPTADTHGLIFIAFLPFSWPTAAYFSLQFTSFHFYPSRFSEGRISERESER